MNHKGKPEKRAEQEIQVHGKTTRTRFTADATPELIKRFDAVCKAAGKTRVEVLEDMVDIWEAVYEDQ